MFLLEDSFPPQHPMFFFTEGSRFLLYMKLRTEQGGLNGRLKAPAAVP